MASTVGYASNSAAGAASVGLERASETRQDASRRIGSGKRHDSASGNAANVAIAVSMLSQQGGTQQAYKNTQEGVAMLQTAESGYKGMSDVLNRMRELAVQSASDTMGVADRKSLDTEFQDLSDELNRLSGSTEYNGIPLMNGEAGKGGAVAFQVGSGGGVSDQISTMLNAQDTDSLGLEGAGVSDQGQAMGTITAIDGALKQLATDQAKIGSTINQLGGAASHLSAQNLAQSSALSNVLDADIGAESTALAGAGVQEKAAIAMMLQANSQSDAVLRLLS